MTEPAEPPPPCGVRIDVVDAFTTVPFAGNPAAVCRLEAWPAASWMQQVAAEMNLAETAFVVPRDVPDEYDLRWFTPAVEVDLCGHATLATAHVLVCAGPVRFHTRSGILTCTRRGPCLELDLPASAGRARRHRAPARRGARGPGAHRPAGAFLLAEVADASTVRELTPDVAALAAVDPHGVIVTAAGDGGYDVVSRVFAPNLGIAEDPVTGAADCQLGPFWAARLGRDELRAWQASRRGGELGVRVAGDRVVLSGTAVTVLSGTLGGAS